jgi:hypothetical protein
MENQHRKITGYRELNQTEVDLLNEVKALRPQIESVLVKVRNHIDAQRAIDNNTDNGVSSLRMTNATPERFLDLAKTELQTGLMYVTRAVAQPEFF